MNWATPGPRASDKERANALRQRAEIAAILSELDPTVTMSARDCWYELLSLAAVYDVLDALATTIPAWSPDPAAMPYPAPEERKEV